METNYSLNPITPETLTPAHVGGLSLHEVTNTYGTLGLIHRLNGTLEQVGLANNEQIEWALQFGLMLHANDRRTNGHYTDHLLRVAIRIIERYSITDSSIISAALVHDGPEDHAKEIVLALSGEVVEDKAEALEKSFELLPAFVGNDTTEILRLVTAPDLPDDEHKLAAYQEYTWKLITQSPAARVVKLSDFTDNAVGNHYTVGPKRRKLDIKYIDLYQLHRMGLFLPDSLITGEARVYALKQLTRGHARSLARIAMAA